MNQLEWERKRVERFNELLYYAKQVPDQREPRNIRRTELDRGRAAYKGRYGPTFCGHTAGSHEGKMIAAVIKELDEQLPKKLVTEPLRGGRPRKHD